MGGEPAIELERIYAQKQLIGKGVGSALMNACLDHAARHSFESVWLGVWERNERAISFYERFGFKAVGETTFLIGTDLQRDVVFELRLKRR